MQIFYIKADEIKDFEDCISGEEQESIIAGNNTAVGCRWDDGTACGVLSIKSTPEGDLEDRDHPVIDFFFVKEEYRRKKVFSSMISFVKEGITQKGSIILKTIHPEMTETEEILRHMGFKRLTDGNTIYRFPMMQLVRSDLLKLNLSNEGCCRSFEELDNYSKNQFLEGFETNFPRHLSPDSALGGVKNICQLHSYVIVVKDEIRGFILSRLLDENCIYIGAVYIDQRFSPLIGPALKTLVKGLLCDPYIETVMISASSESGDKLAKRVVKTVKKGLETQLVRYYILF